MYVFTHNYTLQWNCHVLDVIQKANKRIYFLILLKLLSITTEDLQSFEQIEAKLGSYFGQSQQRGEKRGKVDLNYQKWSVKH